MPVSRRFALALPALAAAILATGSVACGGTRSGSATPARGASVRNYDWPRFGYGPQRSNDVEFATGVDPGRLFRTQVSLPGTVDSSPIYLHGVSVGGVTRNVFVVTTTYGRTLAIDASPPHSILWTYTPPGFSGWDGSDRITTATPVADPDRLYVYAAAPDGLIHKLRLSNGTEVTTGDWPARVTFAPQTEKIASALNEYHGYLFVSTGGYIGDIPPYIGHVSVIVAATGQRLHTFNSLCANQHLLIPPDRCPHSDSAIWARSGVVVDLATGDLLAATGNGLYDGRTNFGDSVLELAPLAGRLLHHYTPRTYQQLDSGDLDLGSTAPALLVAPSRRTPGYLVQGGKDGLLRLVGLGAMGLGTAVQEVPTPGGAMLFSAIAVRWRLGHDWVYVADGSGTACWAFTGSPARLHLVWQNSTPGTSPVLAGGMLYVYDPAGGLNVYHPETGQRAATLSAGAGHWQSPIVADRQIVVAEGDANSHLQSGVLDIWGP
jgi:hypothetical protein